MIAVQEANRRYEQRILPRMTFHPLDGYTFGEVVDKIFALKDRQASLDMIESYSKFWTQMKAGQGFSGKKTINAYSQFDELY